MISEYTNKTMTTAADTGRVRAYHFLRDDMTSGYGDEPAWTEGEERTYEGEIKICERGYHSSPSWYDALLYAPGNMACIVEVSEPVGRERDKFVSRTRKLIAAVNVATELRLWTVDCARRALERERDAGRDPNHRSWAALDVAAAYAHGEADAEDVAQAARAAAWAARSASWAAAWSVAWAARPASWAAAWSVARSAAAVEARTAEEEWQREALDQRMAEAFAVKREG